MVPLLYYFAAACIVSAFVVMLRLVILAEIHATSKTATMLSWSVFE